MFIKLFYFLSGQCKRAVLQSTKHLQNVTSAEKATCNFFLAAAVSEKGIRTSELKVKRYRQINYKLIMLQINEIW